MNTTEGTSANAVGGSALSEVLGAASEARGCDNCGKRGPWQTEHGTGKNKAMTYDLAECHHYPKPAWWRNAGALEMQLEELLKDAERYRWLRDTNNNTDIRPNDEHLEPFQVPVIYVGHPPENWTLGAFASAPVGDGFDRAIDAAMAAALAVGTA